MFPRLFMICHLELKITMKSRIYHNYVLTSILTINKYNLHNFIYYTKIYII